MATKVKVYFKDGNDPLVLDAGTYETTREGHLLVRRAEDGVVVATFAAGLWAAALTVVVEEEKPAPAKRAGRPPKVKGEQQLPIDPENLPAAPVPPLGREG